VVKIDRLLDSVLSPNESGVGQATYAISRMMDYRMNCWTIDFLNSAHHQSRSLCSCTSSDYSGHVCVYSATM